MTKRDPMCLDCRDGNIRACDLWPYTCRAQSNAEQAARTLTPEEARAAVELMNALDGQIGFTP